MPSGSTGQAAWRLSRPPAATRRGEDRQFDSNSLQQRAERTVIAWLQPIARLKVADAGEDRVGHWIDERIDLHIAGIWATCITDHPCDPAAGWRGSLNFPSIKKSTTRFR